MTKPTPRQRLAEQALGVSIAEWCDDSDRRPHDDARPSWYRLAVQLEIEIGETVTPETLRKWYARSRPEGG